jgi:hypothetical protein
MAPMSSELNPSNTPRLGWSRLALVAGAIAVLVVAALAGIWLAPLIRGDKPAASAPASTPAAPAPEPKADAPVAEEPATVIEASREARPRPKKKVEAPAPAAAPEPVAPTTGELHIESDVHGAMVFIDRKFIGNTPVTAKDVAPGRHQLNLTAEGFDGYSESIDVAVGPADVMVKFKEIRLSESVDVVHKHGIGSCEGRLLADPHGLRYETSNKDDAFTVKFTEIETFEVDYLNKNLKLKKRGGRQFNFTTKAPNADPLFVFHRNVDKVRKQVAGK